MNNRPGRIKRNYFNAHKGNDYSLERQFFVNFGSNLFYQIEIPASVSRKVPCKIDYISFLMSFLTNPNFLITETFGLPPIPSGALPGGKFHQRVAISGTSKEVDVYWTQLAPTDTKPDIFILEASALPVIPGVKPGPIQRSYQRVPISGTMKEVDVYWTASTQIGCRRPL